MRFKSKRRQVRDNLAKATQVEVTEVPKITRPTWPYLHGATRGPDGRPQLRRVS